MAVPLQRFTIARPEVSELLPALLAKLSGTPARPSPASAAAKAAAGEPDYSAPAGAPFTAEEVKVPAATYTLAGTLLVPKSGTRHPAVVMVTGSGLQTRDSRIPIPGLERYAFFRQIAERLASNGVAVLRVDDRGI